MKRILSFLFGIMLCLFVQAQFPYGTTGLLHMPTADMQRDKTVMVGGSYLSEGATPGHWDYDTYNYYLNITLFPFMEVGYTCTMNKGKEGAYWPKSTWGKFTNQDRQFSGRLRVIKEGQFLKYMPAIVLGGNDVLTRAWDNSDKGFANPDEAGNGHWNRWYIAATKHVDFYGDLGIHSAYLYNRRVDYKLNGIALGANWKPRFNINLNLMAEYDSRSVNCGLGYSFWKDNVNFIAELNDFKYFSAGVFFKIKLE